jgi:hypothetical protein
MHVAGEIAPDVQGELADPAGNLLGGQERGKWLEGWVMGHGGLEDRLYLAAIYNGRGNGHDA